MNGKHIAVGAVVVVLVLSSAYLSVGGGTAGDSRDLSFDEVGESAGLNYTTAEVRDVTRGGGVYVSDYNNDQRPDVLALGGIPQRGWVDLLDPRPVLYENTNGSLAESDVLPYAASKNRTIQSALFFDYDNDGWEDLLLLPRYDSPVFLENDEGEFRQRDVGFDTELAVPIGATVGDYDKDGYLDLVVFQNGNWNRRVPKAYKEPNRSISDDNGNPNLLFDGDGESFERVNDSGIEGERWSLAASSVDLTGDGWPDVHVANDYNNDYLYVNQRNGSFRTIELPNYTDRNAMSSEIADVNRDGRQDIFVTNININDSDISNRGVRGYLRGIFGKRSSGNNLLINEGSGEFSDKAEEFNVRQGGWGWAAVVTDFDNDGQLDLVHTTKRFSLQATRNPVNVSRETFRYPAVWTGEDGSFESRDASALGFEQTDGRGLAGLDYNRDGQMDLAVATWSEQTYRLYETQGSSGRWLQIDLEGTPSQTPIGATVRVSTENGAVVQKYLDRSDYLSQDSRVLHFGAVDSPTVDVVVVWPDGTERRYSDVPTNQRVVLSPSGADSE